MSNPLASRFDLSGKTALVTGASSGLGEHFARLLSSAGARVAVAARRVERLQELVKEIESTGGQALAVPMDMASPEQFEQSVDKVESELGPIDILINNAGISGDGCFWQDRTAEDWQSVMDTNLNGLWALTQVVCRKIAAAGRPAAIVNIASIHGIRSGLLKLPYNVSKTAVIGLTEALAAEFSQQKLPIRINALCPGYFATEINAPYSEDEAGRRYIEKTPAGRMGNYEELDGALLLLASDAGSFIHGTSLVVDGGHTAKPI